MASPAGFGSLDASRTLVWKHMRWHSAGATFFPTNPRDFDELEPLIDGWIVPGHAPSAALLTDAVEVMTLGSCFAHELRSYLRRAGFMSNHLMIPEGLNNTFAILDFVSWVVTGESRHGFAYDRAEDGEIREWAPPQERALYRESFARAGAFVFTLGLAEVWTDRETGGVFWRGVPDHIFDENRHLFRLSSVEENEENVVQIVEQLRNINPTAPIVMTLSPVPLTATFRPITTMTADCVSKSTLRVALDRVMSRELENVWYWPSFEIVRWAGAHAKWRAYGYGTVDGRDALHVGDYVVARIIDAFVRNWYDADSYRRFRALDLLPPHPMSARARLRRLSGYPALARAALAARVCR